MLQVLKLFLLQPLLSSTKRSWRPMTVGCVRWCPLQDAQRKMRNSVVDIKVYSAALPVTAVVLISHYPRTDYLPIQRAESLLRNSELTALAISPLTVVTRLKECWQEYVGLEILRHGRSSKLQHKIKCFI